MCPCRLPRSPQIPHDGITRMFKPGVSRYPDSGALTFSFSGCQAFDTDRPHRVPLCQPLPAIWKPGREFEKDVKKITSEPVNSLKTNRRLRETNSKRTPNEAENGALNTRNRLNKTMGHQTASTPCYFAPSGIAAKNGANLPTPAVSLASGRPAFRGSIRISRRPARSESGSMVRGPRKLGYVCRHTGRASL